MLIYVSPRMFSPVAIESDLAFARKLRNFSLCGFPVGAIAIGSNLFLGMQGNWPMLAVMSAAGILTSVSSFFGWQISRRSIANDEYDFQVSSLIMRHWLTMPWSESIEADIGHWARTNGVVINYTTDRGFKKAGVTYHKPPTRLYLSFASEEDRILFRLKWL